MFASEIKETIFLGLGLTLAATVLTLVAFVMGIRSDLASAQNDEIAARYTMEAYTTYNKYQSQILYGEDVMAIIREFANTDIVVYVDTLVCESGSSSFYMDKDAYIANPGKYSIESLEYGKYQNNDTGLMGGIKRNISYYSYLVFGKYRKEDIINARFKTELSKGSYSDVTAIVIKKVGDTRAAFSEQKIANYENTL